LRVSEALGPCCGPRRAPTLTAAARQFYTRCACVVREIVRRHEGHKILLVTHGTVIEACLRALAPELRVPHLPEGSITELAWDTLAEAWVPERVGEVGYEDMEFEAVEIVEWRESERVLESEE